MLDGFACVFVRVSSGLQWNPILIIKVLMHRTRQIPKRILGRTVHPLKLDHTHTHMSQLHTSLRFEEGFMCSILFFVREGNQRGVALTEGLS